MGPPGSADTVKRARTRLVGGRRLRSMSRRDGVNGAAWMAPSGLMRWASPAALQRRGLRKHALEARSAHRQGGRVGTRRGRVVRDGAPSDKDSLLKPWRKKEWWTQSKRRCVEHRRGVQSSACVTTRVDGANRGGSGWAEVTLGPADLTLLAA